MMRTIARILASSVTSALVASCGGTGGPPPEAPAPPPSVEPAPVASVEPAPSAPSPPAAFAALRDRILDRWLADEPAQGRYLGLHEHDGKVGDYTAEGIARRIERLREAARALAAIDTSALSPDDRLDHALVSSHVDLSLFRLVDLAEPSTRPQFYGELFEVDVYVNRDYAPLAERAKRLLAHEKAALAQVPAIEANLKSPLSKPVAETAVKIYKGYADYLRGDVAKIMGAVGDATFRDEFGKTNAELARAAEKLAKHFEAEAKKGDESHVLGRARFEKLLRVQEGLTVPLAELKKMAENDLAQNKRAYLELKPKVKKITRPKASDLFAEASRLTEAARKFVIEAVLVTIPGEERATAKETPPYMRWNSAFLDMPGPFDTVKDGFYYITLPEPSWSKKEREEYVMTHGILLATTVHEVYPGHFLQGQWLRRAPTRAQKMLASYSFTEGWAHYAEQMMVEQGFGGDDPQNRLGQLSDALLRNCRFVASIGIHTEGMTITEAERRFREDCFQDAATARQQAVRGTFDPGYFAYTLGKLQILALRDEAKKRLGSRFSLQKFHDALLSHGAPPIPLIRERVLADLERGAP